MLPLSSLVIVQSVATVAAHSATPGRASEADRQLPASGMTRLTSCIKYDEVDEHVELPLVAPVRIPNALHPIALFGSARLDRARGSGRGGTAAQRRPSQISLARRPPVAPVERQPRTAGFQRNLSSISPGLCTQKKSPRRSAVSAIVVNSQGSLSPCATGAACDTRSSRPMACRRRAVWGCRAPGRALTPAIRRQPGGTVIFRTGTDAFA